MGEISHLQVLTTFPLMRARTGLEPGVINSFLANKDAPRGWLFLHLQHFGGGHLRRKMESYHFLIHQHRIWGYDTSFATWNPKARI